MRKHRKLGSSTARSRRRSPRVAAQRAAAALTAALFVLAHGAVVAHYASVEHVVCEAHGHVEHGPSEHGPSEHGPSEHVDHRHHHPDGPHGLADGAPAPAESARDVALSRAPASEVSAHQGCGLEDGIRPSDVALGGPGPAIVPQPPVAAALLIPDGAAQAIASTPLLSVAPKTSPPGPGLAAV